MNLLSYKWNLARLGKARPGPARQGPARLASNLEGC